MKRNESDIDSNDVRTLAKGAGLSMPRDRLEQLQRTLSTYRENVARLREVEPGDCEPPAITYESEVTR